MSAITHVLTSPAMSPIAPSDATTSGLRVQTNVLVVEDNALCRSVTTRALQRLGFTVDLAHSGSEAIEMTARKDYLAIFMDLQMPGIDGCTAATAIRCRDMDGKHTPIIAMTAHMLDGARHRCLAAGMDDCLAKPVYISAVSVLLDRLLELPLEPEHGHETFFSSAALTDIGDAATEAALVSMFLAQAAQRLPSVKAAIDNADAERLHQLARQLEGSAAIVGASRISHLCDALCTVATSGTPEDLAAVHRQLAGALNHTVAAMNAYVEELPQ